MRRIVYLLVFALLFFVVLYSVDFSVSINNSTAAFLLEGLIFLSAFCFVSRFSGAPENFQKNIYFCSVGLCVFVNGNLIFYKISGSLLNTIFIYVFSLLLVYKISEALTAKRIIKKLNGKNKPENS